MAKGAYIGAEDPRNRLGDVAVGTVVKINEDGSPVDYIVVHQGLPSAMYDESCNGTWLLRSTYWKKTSMKFGSTNDYASSTAHSYLNNASNARYPLSTYDEKLRNAIKTVKIPYRVGSGNGTTIASGANGLTAKLFLLSAKEVGASGYSYLPDDGACLAYFYPSSYENSKRAIDDGGWVQWVLRSPKVNTSDTNQMISVDYNGRGELGVHYFEGNVSIRHAMILPLNLAIDDDGFISGDFTGGSVARKIKKGYIGIGNVARKIKKAYIGIGGVARPCWSGGELAYYGTITPLQYARYNLAATSNENYALFGGGTTGPDYLSNVDAYDKSLTRTSATNFRTSSMQLAATTIGNYALFGGGQGDSGLTKYVHAYDTTLTMSTPTDLSSTAYNLSATTVGNYALFGGGRYSSSGYRDVVNAYNQSLTRTTATALNVGRAFMAATTVGNYALFTGGGAKGGQKDEVDAYNASLTHTNPTYLSNTKRYHAATTVGDHALIGACYSNTTVDVYDTSLTRSATAQPALYGDYGSATSVGNYAIFSRGCDSMEDIYYATAEVYDASLTKCLTFTLASARINMAATTVGDYALFGGGYPSTGSSAVVDAFTVA